MTLADHIPVAPLDEKLGITVLEATAERVVARMPVAGNTQPFGLLHGGAFMVLAESLGSILCSIQAWPDRVPVGTDVNGTFHRAVSSGHVTGVATMIRAGRQLATVEIVISDDEGRRAATARLTCFLRPLDDEARAKAAEASRPEPSAQRP